MMHNRIWWRYQAQPIWLPACQELSDPYVDTGSLNKMNGEYLDSMTRKKSAPGWFSLASPSLSPRHAPNTHVSAWTSLPRTARQGERYGPGYWRICHALASNQASQPSNDCIRILLQNDQEMSRFLQRQCDGQTHYVFSSDYITSCSHAPPYCNVCRDCPAPVIHCPWLAYHIIIYIEGLDTTWHMQRPN